VQGAIRIARHFPTRQHPDFTPMLVLNTIFGGYFGSRLMANIREEKGYTYGIYSQIYNYRKDGALLIATEAGRDVCELAITEIYKEMDLICNEKVDDEELLLVKNYLLGNLLGDLDGPFSIMQRWKNIILNDLPAEQFDRNIEIYKTVTPAKLQELAQKYLNKEDYYELVVI
jgi:zinc protease